MHLVDKYEELNMRTYVDSNDAKLVFWKEQNKGLKEQMEHMVDNLKNPFDEMYNWCKGELYDLMALEDAMQARLAIEKNKKRLEQKKKDLEDDIDNITAGKKTVRTLMKNQNDIQNITN